MHRYRCCLATVIAVATVLHVTAGYALINPRFTPVQLVEEATLIVWVDVEQGKSKDQYTAAIHEVLKGKTEVKSFQLDLSRARDAQSADILRDLAAVGKPALFFVGEFEDAEDQGTRAVGRRGFLHISGRWAVFEDGRDGVWTLDHIDRTLQAVWAGGTDMLRRAVDYILEDDDPVVPVADGVSWSEGPLKIVTLHGKINSARPIDLSGDINNDGRQDALIAYGRSSPQVFFNRGFRSFGFAQTLNLGWPQLLPAAEAGQQSACFGDFDGDGAQDMVLALSNGEVWLVHRENREREALMAVVTLPIGSLYKGPLAVTGWIEQRCLGAWNVLPGVSQGCFGRTDAGPVTLKWRLPGAKEQARYVILESGGNARVEIK